MSRDFSSPPVDLASGPGKRAEDEHFLRGLNAVLGDACFDLPSFDPSTDLLKPIIYVVGAPRSGTALLHQVLARLLPVDYVDNVVARFWRRPAIGLHLSRILLGADRYKFIAFRSTLGVSEGLAGPHEFGYFWEHYFRYRETRTHHLDEAELARVDLAGLQAALRNEVLANASNGFLFKNLTSGFQASTLARLHPRSLFVHIVRDTYSTAASILHWRNRLHGSFEPWFSLKPKAYPLGELKSDPAAQVVAQIRATHDELDDVLSRPGVNALIVDYADLCANPGGIVSRVAKSLHTLGSEMTPRHNRVPAVAVWCCCDAARAHCATPGRIVPRGCRTTVDGAHGHRWRRRSDRPDLRYRLVAGLDA